ncbi:hypothetical protein KI387_039274, partial [Taxus chinensis]
CGCGTIPLEAAEYFSGQVMCLGGDASPKAVAAAERNSQDLKEPCDVLHWDATRLPLRTGCVDRIICDMPFGVRCGSTRVRQWLCPKVLREMVRVLALNTGLVVLMVQGKFMRKEVEINQNRFLRLLKHLHVRMEGIRVEVFVMQRTSELAPEHGQAIADHLAEAPLPDNQPPHEQFLDESINIIDHEYTPIKMTLFFDGSKCQQGGGVGIIIIPPWGTPIPLSFKLNFECTNNMEEYEALIMGLQTAIMLSVQILDIYGDSQLVINQIKGIYQCKNEILQKYKTIVEFLLEAFDHYTIQTVP